MTTLRKHTRSSASATSTIDQLQRDLDDVETHVRMIHNYERITPYIVEHEQYGISFKFIVYHKESEAWFGKPFADGSIRDSRHLLAADDVAFDFGCNSGYHSTWMALNVPHGKVFAFDPFPWNAAATRAQAILNNCHNVTVYDCGVGDGDRVIEVTTNSSKTFNADTSGQTFPIKVRNVESFRRHQPRFLKIDIEGAEAELANTSLMQWPSVRAGYVEMHPEFIATAGRDPSTFLNAASEAGFSLSLDGTPVRPPFTTVLPTAYVFERGTDKAASTGMGKDQRSQEGLVDRLADRASLTADSILSGPPFKAFAKALRRMRGTVADALVAPRPVVSVTEVIALAESTLEGWCTREKAMAIAEIVATDRPALCVEIGVYGGRSLVPAAAALRANGAGVIYGIETWRPDIAVEHATSEENDAWWRKLDFGAIKSAFLKFLVNNDLTMQVRLIEAPSADAAALFRTIDYLHIDGAHSTYNAAEDVVLYASKVRAGGIIIMDDTNWTTTAPAVAILDSIADRVRSFPDEHGNPTCTVFRKR